MSSDNQLAAAIRQCSTALTLIADALDRQSPPPAASPSPRALTVRQAAERLGVSEKHVRREIAAGRLRCVRVGRRCLVPESMIASALAVEL